MHFVMQQDAAQIKEDSWDGEYYAIDSVEEIPPDVAVTTNQETEKHRSWTTPHE
jgi:hypothetical protein